MDASDADGGIPFDCKHVDVVEECDAGWCQIPAGCFVVGSPKDEWGRGANTENQVKVTFTRAFSIQQKETTQAEWTAFGFPNPSAPPDQPGNAGDCVAADCPIGNVTWFEAATFANAVSEKNGFNPCYVLEGCAGSMGAGMTCTSIGTTATTYYECEGYRLPGEAEWEYAARAGSTSAFYSGPITQTGSDPLACAVDDNLATAAWYCSNSGDLTHPGGTKAKNSWGLFDMLGNAHEWTNDTMKGLGYGSTPLVDPWGVLKITDPIEAVVLRGGGPISPASRCRAAAHFSGPRSGRGGGAGFRLVRSLVPKSDAGTTDGGVDSGPADSSAE